MKKKTIGIIGPGEHFKKKILPVLKRSNFFKITGILRKRKKKFSNYKIFRDETFFNKKFDFIYISSPNTSHEKYILKSLNNNSHVICEKPFLTNDKKLKKIIQISKKKKKLIFEAFMFLYHPCFNYIKNLKKKNLKYLIANFRFPSQNKKNNRYDKKRGNGYLFDAACYLVAFDNNFFNNIKKQNVILCQKIKKDVDLRGNFVINSNKINRFYFWGEGQNYQNNIELFYDDKVIFIEKFFSKKNNEKIKIKIIKNNNVKIIKLKRKNHFFEMFRVIEKNYDNILFQNSQRQKIEDQLNLIKKIY